MWTLMDPTLNPNEGREHPTLVIGMISIKTEKSQDISVNFFFFNIIGLKDIQL